MDVTFRVLRQVVGEEDKERVLWGVFKVVENVKGDILCVIGESVVPLQDDEGSLRDLLCSLNNALNRSNAGMVEDYSRPSNELITTLLKVFNKPVD